MQHGNAVDEAVDPERPLSEKGVRDVEAVSAFLSDAGIGQPPIWHSGKMRARQTAERLAVHLKAHAPQEQEGLKPKDPVKVVSQAVKGLQDDLVIVGHLPHLSRLTSRLLTGDEEAAVVAFQQGGVVCLERSASGQWAVRWMVVPELFRG
jgi:phosphohistidine phosphatase